MARYQIVFSHCWGMFSLGGVAKAAVCYCLNSIWFGATLRHVQKTGSANARKDFDRPKGENVP